MPVTPQNIATALGRAAPTATEAPQWQMWIDDAEMLIDTRIAELSHTDPIDEAKRDYVVREAVVAQVRRPDDATQITVSVTDASTTKAYRTARGRVTILDEWWTLLGLVSTNTGKAFAVDTAVGAGVHDPICALNFGSTYCSCGADLTNYAYPLFPSDPGWYP